MSKRRITVGFICILCPLGCELKVSHDERRILDVRGNRCVRGAEYAEREVFDPVRVVTTTVRILGGGSGLLPVKSAGVMGDSGPTRMCSGLAIRDSCSTRCSPTRSRPRRIGQDLLNG